MSEVRTQRPAHGIQAGGEGLGRQNRTSPVRPASCSPFSSRRPHVLKSAPACPLPRVLSFTGARTRCRSLGVRQARTYSAHIVPSHPTWCGCFLTPSLWACEPPHSALTLSLMTPTIPTQRCRSLSPTPDSSHCPMGRPTGALGRCWALPCPQGSALTAAAPGVPTASLQPGVTCGSHLWPQEPGGWWTAASVSDFE